MSSGMRGVFAVWGAWVVALGGHLSGARGQEAVIVGPIPLLGIGHPPAALRSLVLKNETGNDIDEGGYLRIADLTLGCCTGWYWIKEIPEGRSREVFGVLHPGHTTYLEFTYRLDRCPDLQRESLFVAKVGSAPVAMVLRGGLDNRPLMGQQHRPAKVPAAGGGVGDRVSQPGLIQAERGDLIEIAYDSARPITADQTDVQVQPAGILEPLGLRRVVPANPPGTTTVVAVFGIRCAGRATIRLEVHGQIFEYQVIAR